MKVISVVVPMHNEEAVLQDFVDRFSKLVSQLDSRFIFEVIIVDDGSVDSTWRLIAGASKRHSWIKGVRLTRNFGHQIALTCGHNYASGDAIVDMDGDLQDPPELIPEMITAWENGADVVLCKRRERKGESVFKLASARLFYKIINFLSEVDLHEEVGDFRLISRKVNSEFVKMTEKSRYVRGMISWMGYKTETISYVRDEREVGRTNYSLRKMLRLATNGIVSMSSRPLKMAYVLAILGSVPFLLYLFIAFIRATFFDIPMVQGWSSTILAIVAFGIMILFMLGIIGEYIARIYNEIKPRPLFLVNSVVMRGEQVLDEHK